jgi:DNA-binding IclR family transcriptional regulator
MDVARELGWTKTSADCHIMTLLSLGYLKTDEATRRYDPTVKVLSLGDAALNALSLPESAFPGLEQSSH